MDVLEHAVHIYDECNDNDLKKEFGNSIGDAVKMPGLEEINMDVALLVIHEWRDRVCRGAVLLEVKSPKYAHVFKGMALLEVDNEVRFIRCTSAQNKAGEGDICVYHAGKLVYLMNIPGRVSETRCYKNNLVIHGNIRDLIDKPKFLRDNVPAAYDLLYHLWSIGIGFGRVPQAAFCTFCGKPERLATCPLCMSTVHQHCAEELSVLNKRLGGFKRPAVDFSHLTHWLDPVRGSVCFCQLCMNNINIC